MSGVVFTGFGDGIVGVCEKYLYFGCIEEAIYRQEDGSKVIFGEDLSENLLLTIVRIISWVVTAGILPLIAAVAAFCFKQESDGQALKPWQQINLYEGSSDYAVSAYFYECLQASKIDEIAYDNIYPCLLREQRSQVFFDSDGPYYTQEKGPDHIAVIIAADLQMSHHLAQAQSTEFNMPVCILSPGDSIRAAFCPNGKKLSRAFKQVLTHRI